MSLQSEMVTDLEAIEVHLAGLAEKVTHFKTLHAEAVQTVAAAAPPQGPTAAGHPHSVQALYQVIGLHRFYLAMSQRLRALGAAGLLDATPTTQPPPGSTDNWVATMTGDIERLVP